MTAHKLLVGAAILCFVLGAFGVAARVNWMLFGFACLTATLLI